MRKRGELGLVMLALIALSGCSEEVPQLDHFASYLQQETQKDCKAMCRFVSASKTDGQSQEFAGIKMYEMHVNIRVEALQALDWSGPGAMNGWIVVANAGGLFAAAHHARQGEMVDIPAILHFQKFESGWRINQISRLS